MTHVTNDKRDTTRRATHDTDDTTSAMNDDTDDKRDKAGIVRLASAPQWLTGPMAADALGVSLRTLQRMASRGDVTRQKRGRRTYFRVDAAIARDTNDATQQTTRATRDTTSDTMHATMLALTDRLAAAESRAAVAEYRAEHALDLFERTDAKLSDALRRLGEAEHRARVAEAKGKLTAIESAAIILALVVAFVLGGIVL